MTDNIGRFFLLLFPSLLNQNLSEMQHLDTITNSTLGIIKTKKPINISKDGKLIFPRELYPYQ